jgi:hypothetical protein
VRDRRKVVERTRITTEEKKDLHAARHDWLMELIPKRVVV